MTRYARCASSVALLSVTSALIAAPAFAADPSDPSVVGQDPATMPVSQAVLMFAVIPLALAFVIWLLVSAPGWTRGGRPSQADAWTGEPHVVDGGAVPAVVAADEAAGEIEGATDGTGGTSARW